MHKFPQQLRWPGLWYDHWCFWWERCDKEEGSHLPPLLQTLPFPAEVTFRGFTGPVVFLPHLSFFSFSGFGTQILNTRAFKSNCNIGKIRKWLCMSRERHKRDMRRLSLYLRLIPGIDNKSTNKCIHKKQQTLRKGENLRKWENLELPDY